MNDMEKEIERLCNDRDAFNKFVYTPVDDAVKELERRQNDKELQKKIEDLMKDNIPDPFTKNSKFVLARHLVTPNYEVSRFLIISDVLGFEPIFFEYHDDKLIFKNPWKYSLGKMPFYSGKGKKGGMKIEHIDVIDFNASHGKKISTINTKWGQSLIDFHHDFFIERFPRYRESLFNGSEWYFRNGGDPALYYERFLMLFITHGILFENFFLDDTEIDFTKNIILPAIISIKEKFGVKPLIVALEPTEVEGDGFWLCHPTCTQHIISKKLLI